MFNFACIWKQNFLQKFFNPEVTVNTWRMEYFLKDFLSDTQYALVRTAALALAKRHTVDNLRKLMDEVFSEQRKPGINKEAARGLNMQLAKLEAAFEARWAYEEKKLGPLRAQFGVVPSKIDAQSTDRVKRELQTNVIEGICRDEIKQRTTPETLKEAGEFVHALWYFIKKARASTEKGGPGERFLQTLFCSSLGGIPNITISQFLSLGRYEADVRIVGNENNITILEMKKDDTTLDVAILQDTLYGVQYCMEDETRDVHIQTVMEDGIEVFHIVVPIRDETTRTY
ncbi:MAG: uncharacterized protein A8A55_3320 [Amphiamblys sp. WSBS2006]|nr:MAG: uncharacterized protein A8A55_3320 [Amphiamblys sp. WSBS2006]